MSNTRRIEVPSAITLTDRMTGQPGQVIGFFDWACLQWLNDQRWHANMARLIATVPKIEKARGNHGPINIDLADEDWKILCEVVKSPAPTQSVPLQAPLIAIQLEAYKNAVLDAKAVEN